MDTRDCLEQLLVTVSEILTGKIVAAVTTKLEQIVASTHLQREQEELLTIEEAAQFLHVTKSTLYSMSARKELPAHKRSKRLYFLRGELVEWVRAGRSSTKEHTELSVDEHLRKLGERKRSKVRCITNHDSKRK